MLQKKKSKKMTMIKYGLFIPVFLITLMLSSTTISENKILITIAENIKTDRKITELILPKEPAVITNPKLTKQKKKEIPVYKVLEDEIADFKKYISKTIRYPLEAKRADITGDVIIEFTLRNGKITNVKPLNEIAFLTNESINSIQNYKESINKPDGTYTFKVTFILDPKPKSVAFKSAEIGFLTKNIGEILIVGYVSKSLKNASGSIISLSVKDSSYTLKDTIDLKTTITKQKRKQIIKKAKTRP